ncbi:DUF1403 family protein [Tropicimonas sp.]|uniref:DUF1403 family protein n=1 Tax=Tropicimonas sp. TaxID=2067044 RepID=UPI003A8932D7
MTFQSTAISGDQTFLPKVPGWVTSWRAETPETVAFRSGAVLTVLDQLIRDTKHSVPVRLLANQLALSAATATSKLEGRLAREADNRRTTGRPWRDRRRLRRALAWWPRASSRA